jgi:hypothetical protein
MLARRATHKFLRFGKANTRDKSDHKFIYFVYLQHCACFVVNAAVRFLDQLSGLHLQRFLVHEEHKSRLRDDLSDHSRRGRLHHPLHHWRSDCQRAQEYLRLSPASQSRRQRRKSKQKWRRRLKMIAANTVFLSQKPSLKGLSHEIDFDNIVNKGRGWFLNFSEAPLIFS